MLVLYGVRTAVYLKKRLNPMRLQNWKEVKRTGWVCNGGLKRQVQ